MVTSNSTGLRDWMAQRVSAVIVAVYVIFMLGFLLTHPHVEYDLWQDLFANTAMRLFTLLFLASLMWHTWIGLWIVATDYIKPLAIRLLFQVTVIIYLLTCFLWGVQILWGV